jgi:hypothetical protein
MMKKINFLYPWERKNRENTVAFLGVGLNLMYCSTIKVLSSEDRCTGARFKQRAIVLLDIRQFHVNCSMI